MGQQQLLLVILVTIIVGIATVVAINTFSSAADSANVDAVRSDLLSMASAAQGYYMKPEMMGGGGNSFQSIGWTNMGSVPVTPDPDDATVASNENGTYTISGVSSSGDDDEFTITAVPEQAGGSISITINPDDATMNDYTPST